MNVRLIDAPERKLIGIHLTMSLVKNQTGRLWSIFMPRRTELTNLVRSELFSMQVYDDQYFRAFNPSNDFEKWAAMEVKDFQHVPQGMETIIVPAGKYAVFHYIGRSSEGAKAFQYIFQSWLPSSGFTLDQRPHFELLGDLYKNDDPTSEEEIWIPVKE